MVVKTLAQYEQALLRFKSANPEFVQCAKEIGKLLFENEIDNAKALLKDFVIENYLVRWESLALCDLATIEKEKLQVGVSNGHD